MLLGLPPPPGQGDGVAANGQTALVTYGSNWVWAPSRGEGGEGKWRGEGVMVKERGILWRGSWFLGFSFHDFSHLKKREGKG